MENVLLFKALADKSRLSIVSALLKEPSYVEALAERLDLTPATISFHLRKLEKADLVSSKKDQFYVIYKLNEKHLKKSLAELVNVAKADERQQQDRYDSYVKKVENSFFKLGRLKSIPVQRKKRRIVLEKIVSSFKTNREYSEKDVNAILLKFHDDFCTLRRELVAEKLMSRDKGVYRVL